ncbi:hypothetical protein BDR06DRAFT_963075 [Suillus hirtellus]|nr:hypothetical protein BDR06DRAFT_963075 [Suillus hirtellus]
MYKVHITPELDCYSTDSCHVYFATPAPLTSHPKEMTDSDTQHSERVIIARPTLSARKKVLSGLRSQFESKSQSKKTSKDAELAPTSSRNGNANDMGLDIRVRVERSVVVDHTPADESDQWSLWETPEGK